ncbi:MAG: hypothetical protein ACSLEL_03595 [Candidatus Malihini olakiniferum]
MSPRVICFADLYRNGSLFWRQLIVKSFSQKKWVTHCSILPLKTTASKQLATKVAAMTAFTERVVLNVPDFVYVAVTPEEDFPAD